MLHSRIKGSKDHGWSTDSRELGVVIAVDGDRCGESVVGRRDIRGLKPPLAEPITHGLHLVGMDSWHRFPNLAALEGLLDAEEIGKGGRIGN